MYLALTNIFLILLTATSYAQLKWVDVDAEFGPLPAGTHVYRTESTIDGKPNVAYYFTADLKNKKLQFSTDTTLLRRITPLQFYERNKKPVLVVNGTFFSQDDKNLNVVIKDGKPVSFSPSRMRKSSPDTTRLVKVYSSAIGISKKREADVAWLQADSSWKFVKASQFPDPGITYHTRRSTGETVFTEDAFTKWKMQTAIGGGPVLVQDGKVSIANNEEQKFAGKAINDKHPRTAMGYSKNGKLIILVVEGRNPGIAEGMNLIQLAKTLKDLGCLEALNLDGGGSSCMLVNGKETIRPSDATGQRRVPAVFIVQANTN